MLQHVSRSVAVFVLIGLGHALTPLPARGDSWSVTVRGGETALGETPLVVNLKQALPVGHYLMKPASGGDAIPAQVFEDGGEHQMGAVLPRLDARQTVVYSLDGPAPDQGSSAGAGLSFEPHARNLQVKLDQQLFTEYRVDAGNKPFFFPLIGPTGETYTRTVPAAPHEDQDHPHQRSCWFTYGNVNGVDFWSEGKRAGTIRETARKLVATGPVIGRLTTTNEWRSPDNKKICSDERTITFYRTTRARIIDFGFRILASEGPVTFIDTKEGMFGLRVASSMDVNKKRGGKITNAEGLTDEKAWGKASPWVDYVGPVQDKLVGVAIINHPGSFRYPTTWHVRTYGLFAANPFGWHDFGRPEKGDYTIPADGSIAFNYRVVLHEGDTPSANVTALAAAYTKLPVVEIRKD